MKEKIQPKDYYDFFPPNSHRTGDIWRCLPNFGMLPKPHSYGIIVTPACDLAQRKTDTVTYLPVVTVEEYLNSPAFFFEIWQDISQQLAKLKYSDLLNVPGRYELPILEELCEIVSKLEQLSREDSNKKAAFQRMQSYRNYIESQAAGELVPTNVIGQIFANGAFDKLVKKLVRNAHRVDVHFLPGDQKPVDVSAVPAHSVVLFRYALSIPLGILDEAQLSDELTWPSSLARLKRSQPIANTFEKLPIRLATVKDDFLSDLLSRYVSMQIRLGSRDFSDATVDQYAGQMMEEK